MELKELAFIPGAGAGHLAPMVELAETLTARDHRISATIFIMEFPFLSKLNPGTPSLQTNHSTGRVRFVHLTLDKPPSEDLHPKPLGHSIMDQIQLHKSCVKDFYTTNSTNLIGFVVDMICGTFVDVASELGIPTYVFFTSNACFLSLLCYIQSLHDYENRDLAEFKESDCEFSIPGFVNHIPAKVLPSGMFDNENGWSAMCLDISRNLRKAKGILVNSFGELEPYTIKSLSEDRALPPIHMVGPVLNLKPETRKDENALAEYEDIMLWLDKQPPTSVVFLCFGSMGTFPEEQVCEIARALEQSGHRFLWSLRQPPPKGKKEPPTEYENFSGVLPEGFLDRTKDIGKVIGWAPQVTVLSHPSVGGFISHCGWNSIIESLWYGVPIATWPLYAEQQINAFEMVKEWGVAIEIKLDYDKENPVLVAAEEIERGIRQLMEDSESKEVKKKVKAMKEESRRAIVEGGSSYTALGNIIQESLDGSQ